METAKVVRMTSGVAEIEDGPLTNAELILGGYYLVDCASLERVTEIAGRFAEAEFAPIEVRRLSAETTWDTGAPTPGRAR